MRFFQPLPGTPIFDDLIERGEIQPDFVPARHSQLTYTPADMSAEWLCAQFNEILNKFRASKGWNYQNARIGIIRQSVDDEGLNAEGIEILGALPHKVTTKASTFESG